MIMINELKMMWKEVECHNLIYYLGIFMEGMRKNNKIFRQRIGSQVRDLNEGPLKYEVKVLPTPLRLSVRYPVYHNYILNIGLYRTLLQCNMSHNTVRNI
jgi:hypothetical protein